MTLVAKHGMRQVRRSAADYGIMRSLPKLPMAKLPLYKKVREKLIFSLVEGEWRPGEMLPSESELAERYGVGISTIRAAVRELEEAKVLMRAQGKGTFVLHFDDREKTHRFLNVIKNDGTAEQTDRTLLSLERITAPDDVTKALQLPRSSKQSVFKLATVVRLGGKPIFHSNVFLPAEIFARLRRTLLPDGNRSLYSLYQQHFNVNVTRVIDSLSSVPAPPEVARTCMLPPGTWVLKLQRVSFTYNDLPVELRINWVNTSNHCYRIQQGDRS
jgi:GntR family transcriptional regulator